MKRILSLLLALSVAVMCCSAAAAENKTRTKDIPFGELPADHQALFQAEMAEALKNAPYRLPDQMALTVKARGDFNGYTGIHTDGDLSVSYTVSDSVVEVGEKITFTADLSCSAEKMTYTVGGLVMDENFNKIGELTKENGSASQEVYDHTFTADIWYKPTQVCYVNFVLIVIDAEGNQIAFSTNTVQVYQTIEPPFTGVGMDGSLGVILSLDSAEMEVGVPVLAAVEMYTAAYPLSYTASWTLYDEEDNVLDVVDWNGEEAEGSVQNGMVYKSFPYRPLQAGKARFLITVTDQMGQEVMNKSPFIEVVDGFYFEATLNKTAASAGDTVTGTYRIYGHSCMSTYCFVGWTAYDKVDGDQKVQSKSALVTRRSGTDSFIPRVGQLVEFYVGATCEHFPDGYPATAILTLLYGTSVEMSMDAEAIELGDTVTLTYSVMDGQEPYQKITVYGYSSNAETGETGQFLSKTVEEPEGTVAAAPASGDTVWFEIEVAEEDGFVSTWKSGSIPVSGVNRLPGDADENGTVDIHDAYLVLAYGADNTLEINLDNADVNEDGVADQYDALLLLQKAAGWSVTLK